MSGRSHRRPLRSAVLVLLVALLVGAGTVAAIRKDDHKTPVPSSGRVPLGRAVPPQLAGEPARSAVRTAAERRSDALTAVLGSRARAVLRRDRVGFLASVDTGVPAFRRSQLRLFDALSALRFSSWRYDIDAPAIGRPVPDRARFRRVSETYAPASVVVLYQLATYDSAPTSTSAALTFVRRGSRWLLAADADFDHSDRPTQREVWDFGPLTTVSGPRTLVIGPLTDRRLLTRLRAEAERDIPRVSAVWGRRWSQRVAIVVPPGQRQLAAILRKPYASLSRIAAVATAELGGSGPTAAVGNRIMINPAKVDRLGALGRQVVMTHEITHVATRPETAAGAPTWLVEGFADYVAYRATPVPVRAAARELGAAVRAGRLPTALPADADFAGSNPNLAQAYEEAWLAVRLVADRVGTAGLLRFYRAVGSGSTTGGVPGVTTALARELGLTPAGFTAHWRNYLTSTLS